MGFTFILVAHITNKPIKSRKIDKIVSCGLVQLQGVMALGMSHNLVASVVIFLLGESVRKFGN